jgi:hypothetical protein
VAANIVARIAKRPAKAALKPQPKDVILVSLGRGDGVANFGGSVLAGCLPRTIDSRSRAARSSSARSVRSAHGV